MTLIATEDEHVAFFEHVVFPARNQFDLATFTSQVLTCAHGVRNADHASAGRQFHARDLEPGQSVGHEWPEAGILAFTLAYVVGRDEFELGAWCADELLDRYLSAEPRTG